MIVVLFQVVNGKRSCIHISLPFQLHYNDSMLQCALLAHHDI